MTVQYNEDDNPRKLVLSIVSSKRVHFDLSFFLVEHVRQTLYIRVVGTCQDPKGRSVKESNFGDISEKVRERGSCPAVQPVPTTLYTQQLTLSFQEKLSPLITLIYIYPEL